MTVCRACCTLSRKTVLCWSRSPSFNSIMRSECCDSVSAVTLASTLTLILAFAAAVAAAALVDFGAITCRVGCATHRN